MSCVLARFNEDAPRQPNNCNDCEHQGDEDAQCAGGGWVPKRLICRCHGFSLPSRLTRSTSAKGGPPAKSGNGDVADNVQEPAAKDTEVVSPEAAAAASAEDGPPTSDAEQLVAQDAEIARLNQSIAEMDKALELKAEKAEGAKITASTKVTLVTNGKKSLWPNPSKREGLNAKPKGQPTTWKGYCHEGCVCKACVDNRAVSSKVNMHDPFKRKPKEPEKL